MGRGRGEPNAQAPRLARRSVLATTQRAGHRAGGGSGWLVSDLRPHECPVFKDRAGRKCSACLGSDGPWDEVRSSPPAPLLLGLRPLPTAPGGEVLGRGQTTRCGRGSSWGRCPSPAPPSSGRSGLPWTFPCGTVGQASAGRAALASHAQGPRQPREAASATRSAPRRCRRISVPKPRATQGTQLHIPDTTGHEFEPEHATRVTGKGTHCVLPDKACLAARGCWGTLDRGRESSLSLGAPCGRSCSESGFAHKGQVAGKPPVGRCSRGHNRGSPTTPTSSPLLRDFEVH